MPGNHFGPLGALPRKALDGATHRVSQAYDDMIVRLIHYGDIMIMYHIIICYSTTIICFSYCSYCLYMFILLYPHNMPLNHHLTVLTIIKHGIYAVLQEPPSQDPALKFVLRASMSQWCWQACSNQPSCLPAILVHWHHVSLCQYVMVFLAESMDYSACFLGCW